MDWLKKLLEKHGVSEENITAIMKDTGDNQYIPKSRFDEVNKEKKQYKTQVDDLDTQLGELQDKLKDNEGVSKTIDDLKQKIVDKETEMKEVRKSNAIKLKVLESNPNDVADILPHLDGSKITVDDNVLTGLKEQIEVLKENKPYLFKDVGPDGTGGSLGNKAKDKQTKQVNNLGEALAQHYKK